MNRQQVRTVYLAGPMEHVSRESACEWRTIVKANLSGMWDVLDPCRRKHSGHPLEMKRIFELDLRDIRESDIVLANLGNPKLAKHGTAMEVFYAAHTLRIPVVAFGKEETDALHPFFESLVTEWTETPYTAAELLNEQYL